MVAITENINPDLSGENLKFSITTSSSQPIEFKTGDCITVGNQTFKISSGNSAATYEPAKKPEPRRIGDMVLIDNQLIPLRKFKDRKFLDKQGN